MGQMANRYQPFGRLFLCAVVEGGATSGVGTKRSLRCSHRMSVVGGKAENMCSARVFRLLPSRPGEFHPEPLTDPDLILSHHPARAIARRLPPSIFFPSNSSRCRLDPAPVDPIQMAMACPLCSTGVTPLH